MKWDPSKPSKGFNVYPERYSCLQNMHGSTSCTSCVDLRRASEPENTGKRRFAAAYDANETISAPVDGHVLAQPVLQSQKKCDRWHDAVLEVLPTISLVRPRVDILECRIQVLEQSFNGM